MPEPAALPPLAPKAAPPPDLDQAVERALRHGDLRQLRKVMAEAATAVPAPPDPLPAGEPTEEPTDPAIAPPPAPPPASEAVFAELEAALARAARWDDDPAAAAEALRAARPPLQELLARLEAWEAPPLVLPPFRQPWALVLAPPGDEGRVPALAEALEIDVATARQVGLVRHPRAALRGADREDLERRAGRYRARLGLPATVLDEATLGAQPPARLLLALALEGLWRSAWSPSWEPETGALAALAVREAPPPEVCLVVVGELVSTRYREQHGRRKDDVRLVSHGDRRLAVLDLHHAAGVLRVVEGTTRLEGGPGIDPSRSALAFRALPEALAARFPQAVVIERCVCRPMRSPVAGEGGRLEASAWPEWEEHSRSCRVLFEVGAGGAAPPGAPSPPPG
jgi:hypothetical protein